MREIMQEYGRAVITACTVIVLFILIFGLIAVDGKVGFTEILKEKSVLPAREFGRYADAKETLQVMERLRPVVKFQEIEIQAGTKWKAEDLFVAEDAEQNPARVEILKVEGPGQKELEVVDNSVEFLKQGTYRIWIQAIDTYCGVTEKVFFVPVRRGGVL